MSESGISGWTDVAATYADTFAHLCAGTVPALIDSISGVHDRTCTRSQSSPARVLDVGAGTGALAAALAGTGVRVTAVEPDAAMADLAGRTLSTAGAAAVVRAGLPRLPFRAGCFDAVLANFVVNHLPDPRAGVAELARVAAAGAPVVVTIWPSGQTAQSRLWADVIEASGASVPLAVTLPADKDFPRSEEGLAEVFRGAGLQDVRTRTVTWTYDAEPDGMWRGAAAGIGGVGRTLTSQASDVRERMRLEYRRRVAALVSGGRLRLRTEAVLATGTAAVAPHPTKAGQK